MYRFSDGESFPFWSPRRFREKFVHSFLVGTGPDLSGFRGVP